MVRILFYAWPSLGLTLEGLHLIDPVKLIENTSVESNKAFIPTSAADVLYLYVADQLSKKEGIEKVGVHKDPWVIILEGETEVTFKDYFDYISETTTEISFKQALISDYNFNNDDEEDEMD